MVELEDGRILRRHVDYLRVRTTAEEPSVELDEYLPLEVPTQNPESSTADPPTAPAAHTSLSIALVWWLDID